jgi:hypothetical protein
MYIMERQGIYKFKIKLQKSNSFTAILWKSQIVLDITFKALGPDKHDKA